MKSAIIIVAFIITMSLLHSFSTASRIEKIVFNTYKDAEPANTNNGTVKLTICHGTKPLFKEGNFVGIRGIRGFSVLVDNGDGIKIVNFSINITITRLNNTPVAYFNGTSSAPMYLIYQFYIEKITPPAILKITVTVKTDTSTNLSLTRSGYIIFSCPVFINGPKSVTGPS
jgi:hypothetical protein